MRHTWSLESLAAAAQFNARAAAAVVRAPEAVAHEHTTAKAKAEDAEEHHARDDAGKRTPERRLVELSAEEGECGALGGRAADVRGHQSRLTSSKEIQNYNFWYGSRRKALTA